MGKISKLTDKQGVGVYPVTLDDAVVLNSKTKLSTAIRSKGANNQPVYFDGDGVATSINYTVGKSVPEDAVFTDTTYSAATKSADGLMSSTDKTKVDNIDLGSYKLKVASAAGSDANTVYIVV